MPAETSTSRPTAGRELTLLALLYLAYSAARLVADPDLTTATANAHSLLRVEGDLSLDIERPVNAVLAALPALALASSYWYSLLHYVVTPAVLLWVYRSHPDRYRPARNGLVLGSALGIVGFALLPVAPPRMLPGYVDTLAATSDHGWWGADASAPRGLGSLTNELAAMPSLHVGWALWCAAVVLLCASRRWVRVLAVAYPVATTVVVVATANHYLLDAVAGAVVIGAGALLARAPLQLPRLRLRRWAGGLPDLLRVQRQHLPVTDGRGRDAPAGRRPRAHGPGGGRLGGHGRLARR
ncbi:MAG TPA: phosphatase PAP2 family protein [Actinomycetes bacterium]